MPKILLVEDNRLAAMTTCSLLEAMDYTVEVAETGQKALAIYKKGFDLILMDIGLPDTDGVTVTNTIRDQESAEKRIPIIALTAHADEETKVQSLSAGMDGFLAKPVDAKQLTAILDKWLVSMA